MKELLRRLKLKPGLAVEIGAASLFASILALASPLFVIQVLNRYVAHGVDGTLVTLTTGAVLAVILEFFFRQVRLRLARAVSTTPNANIATASYGILIKAKARVLESIQPGQRRQILQASTDIENAYTAANIAAVYDVPFALLFVGVLFLLSPVLSGIVMFFLVMIFTLGAISARSVQGKTRELMQANAAGNSLIGTATNQIDTVRAFNAAGFLRDAWEKHLSLGQGLRRMIEERQGLVQSLTQSGSAMMSIAIVTVAATLVVAGNLDVGAMIGANILAARALMPISKFSQLGTTFTKASQGIDMLTEFAKIPLEADGGSHKPDYMGGIEFKDVAFTHPGTSTPLFESLSVAIKPGTILVITGANGSGKTTLSRLLAGVIEPARGQILADGLDLRQASPEWWRRQIIYLPQEPALLNATIRENLQITRPDIDPAEIGRAVTAAGLGRYMDESPNGIETQVTDNGRSLSLGIRRRIALARALITDGMLAIFDEPTEGLDVEGTACVYAAMKELAIRGRTLVVVSHDPKIVKGAHIVIDLNAKPVPRISERPRSVGGAKTGDKGDKKDGAAT